MTQSLKALFSPETSPSAEDLHVFRLLCDTLFFYVLPGGTPPTPPQLATGYAPVHLPEKEQSRFESLVHELKGHEAEFHRGLLASFFTAHADRDEASAGSLAASLRAGAKSSDPRKTEDEALWQAMLILKLAEMFREEEREINRGFLALSGKEAELFAAIRGDGTEEDGEDEEEKQALREVAAATTLSGPTINLARLAKAWGHLYLRDAEAGEIPLLVTNHQELQGLLAEAYEALTDGTPRQMVSLALPGRTESEGHDDTLTEKFRAETEEARTHFNRLLTEIATGGSISAEQLTALQGAGNDLNRAALPFLQNSPTEQTLHFYAYEGTSFHNLFAGLKGIGPAVPRNNRAASTALLAVLS